MDAEGKKRGWEKTTVSSSNAFRSAVLCSIISLIVGLVSHLTVADVY